MFYVVCTVINELSVHNTLSEAEDKADELCKRITDGYIVILNDKLKEIEYYTINDGYALLYF